MHRLTIRLTPDQYDAVAHLAKRKGTSFAELVRGLIDEACRLGEPPVNEEIPTPLDGNLTVSRAVVAQIVVPLIAGLRFISAVKVIRAATGAGLRQAKHAADRLREEIDRGARDINPKTLNFIRAFEPGYCTAQQLGEVLGVSKEAARDILRVLTPTT